MPKILKSASMLGLAGWRKLLFWFGFWTILGLTEGVRLYVSYNITSIVIPWPQSICWGLLDFYLWWALSPILAWLARRLRFERGQWSKSLIAHVFLSISFSLVELFFYANIYLLVDTIFFHTLRPEMQAFWSLYPYFVRSMINTALMLYFIITFVSYTMIHYQRYRDEELRLAELEGQLARAQLETLKMQLHPHFLFNTLNSISALVKSDPEAADKMIARLGELLRITLDNEANQEIPLRKEIDFLNRYLEIQRMRFRDRLDVNLQIAPELLDALIPSLIIQPIVENAIKHGTSRLTDKGIITISAHRDGGKLCISVEDNGPGMKSGGVNKLIQGRGLSNTAARLEKMYGQRQQLKFNYDHDRGMQVLIEIPFHEAALDSNGVNRL